MLRHVLIAAAVGSTLLVPMTGSAALAEPRRADGPPAQITKPYCDDKGGTFAVQGGARTCTYQTTQGPYYYDSDSDYRTLVFDHNPEPGVEYYHEAYYAYWEIVHVDTYEHTDSQARGGEITTTSRPVSVTGHVTPVTCAFTTEKKYFLEPHPRKTFEHRPFEECARWNMYPRDYTYAV